MKIEITKTEQDILHNALIYYLKDIVKATDKLYELGAVIEKPPALEIRELHSKIVSATEDRLFEQLTEAIRFGEKHK